MNQLPKYEKSYHSNYCILQTPLETFNIPDPSMGVCMPGILLVIPACLSFLFLLKSETCLVPLLCLLSYLGVLITILDMVTVAHHSIVVVAGVLEQTTPFVPTFRDV